MTKIKICGLFRQEDIQTANEILPDYIGFMFWEKSRRYVTISTARELNAMLDERIRAVGVFVDEDPETIAAIANQGIIDIIQLHGSEDDGYIEGLRKMTNKTIIKAFRVNSDEDIRAAGSSTADMVLLDSGFGVGGTGQRFDWRLIRDIGREYFLAGGLDPDNVGEAVLTYEPYAVDVSSGVETDGVKDRSKMIRFVNKAREADNGGKDNG